LLDGGRLPAFVERTLHDQSRHILIDSPAQL